MSATLAKARTNTTLNWPIGWPIGSAYVDLTYRVIVAVTPFAETDRSERIEAVYFYPCQPGSGWTPLTAYAHMRSAEALREPARLSIGRLAGDHARWRRLSPGRRTDGRPLG